MRLAESLGQDVRTAVRVLNRSRGITVLCILSIGLGIGLTTSMFSLGDAMFLRPLAIERPGDVLELSSRGDDGNGIGYGWPDYEDMARSAGSIADLATYERVGGTLETGGERQFVLMYPSSANFFQLLGAKAQLGRASFEPLGGQPAVVIGHRLWQQRFGGDPRIVGKNIVLNDKSLVVAGVMPAEFTGLVRGVPNDVWVSTDDAFNVLGRGDERGQREGQFEIIGRLKAGVNRHAAAAQLDAAIRGPGKRKPAPTGQTGTVLESTFAPGWKATVLGGGSLLLLLGLVLFVPCANVAQLRLAQAEARKKELGIRIALGAGSRRVTRQLLVESALVSIIGAGAGVWLAQFLVQTASGFVTAVMPILDFGLRLDYRVLTFALAATVGSVLLSGLAPAQHAVRLNVSEVLKSDQGATGARGGW